MIDAAEAAKLQAALKNKLGSEEDIAAQLGLSPDGFVIYELIGGAGTSKISEGPRAEYRVGPDEPRKEAAENVEKALVPHSAVVDWQSNVEIQRIMRRDIKRVLRDGEKYTEDELDDLANRIVDAFRSRSAR